MQGLLLFVLPAGRSAEVARPIAQSICDRLWDQGIEPGAATAATRITEALKSNPLFGNDLHFVERELTPLLDAAQVHPRTWTDLLQASNLMAIGSAQRGRLLMMCEDMLTDLTPHHDHDKVSALIGDVEDLRDELRAIERPAHS
jgi:hypothetical protein